MRQFVIENATIITVDGHDRVFKGHVLIQDDRIKDIATESKPAFFRVKDRIDAENCILMPGLVQAHVHLAQVLFRGLAEDLSLLDWLRNRIFPFEAAHDEDSLHLSATIGIAELLLSGTTACLDMGTVRHSNVIFEAAQSLGFRLTSGKAMMDVDDGFSKGLVETTSQSLESSIQLAKKWQGAANGRLSYAMAPRFILSCTEALLRDTAIEARRLGVRIHTHASENPSEVLEVERLVGASNIVALHQMGLTGPDVVLAHCVHLTEEEQVILRETQTHIAHCPTTNLKLASGIADIYGLHELGINIGIGTDGAPCNNRHDGFIEMHLASILQKPKHGASAMNAMQTLRMATMGGAKLLGLEHEIGSIEVGKKADFIIVAMGHPRTLPHSNVLATLVHSCLGSDVRDVFVDGEQLVKNRQLLGVDTEELAAKVSPMLKALQQRASLH